MEDPNKFFNVVIDKTNQKLNSFQAQVIVLESQLQMAMEERDAYKKFVEETPKQTLNVSDFEALKVEFLKIHSQLKACIDENTVLKSQIANSVSNSNNNTKFLQDQNETLLQEIRRLQRLVDELS